MRSCLLIMKLVLLRIHAVRSFCLSSFFAISSRTVTKKTMCQLSLYKKYPRRLREPVANCVICRHETYRQSRVHEQRRIPVLRRPILRRQLALVRLVGIEPIDNVCLVRDPTMLKVPIYVYLLLWEPVAGNLSILCSFLTNLTTCKQKSARKIQVARFFNTQFPGTTSLARLS